MDLLKQISIELQQGQAPAVAKLTSEAIKQNISTSEILNEGLIGGMGVVGERFRTHEIFLPHVLLAARAMHAGMELLKPLLIRDAVPTMGKIILGTVRGDQHDIGKNLVGIMLQGAGFEVIDLGTDVTPADFVAAAEEHKAKVIGMSALLTTTMPVMSEVVELLQQSELSGTVHTVVGGAPVTEEFAQQIGADKYACDALSAVDRIQALVLEESDLRGAP